MEIQSLIPLRKENPPSYGKGTGQDALEWQGFGSRSGATLFTKVPSTRRDGNPFCLSDIFRLYHHLKLPTLYPGETVMVYKYFEFDVPIFWL